MKCLAMMLALPVLICAQQPTKGLPIPQFYTTSDCTGSIDAQSRLWSQPAKHGGDVRPFAVDGSYMQTWAIETCMTSTTVAYSVMLSVDTTACKSGDKTKQLVLKYWQASKTCLEAPTTTTPMTMSQCVAYGRGSVRFSPTISADDLCIGTTWISAVRGGGIMTKNWLNNDCSGTPQSSMEDKDNQKECATEPECSGCCREYSECKAENYTRSVMACRKVGSGYEYALAAPGYTDSTCTTLDKSAVLGLQKIGYDTCVSTMVNGLNISLRLSFVAPLTVDLQCQLVDMLLRNNLDDGVLSWAAFTSLINPAAVASPAHSLVVGIVLLFAVFF
eukprot:TRINITY_DN3447_c0_g1_i4.p1 TRINITY_DN3447_c0_g1~~TRINITY_DN3447_c0_g1_i4.p1  ORF type:complete len:332 (+),score=76.95 TRINITY_DN3447_c0_g1_i4:43-1038(+)